LSELIEVLTKDGSYSLRSVFFEENFHSLLGALEETKSKFTATSNLQRFKGESLNVLDICFGLGYNSASLLDELIKQKSNLNLYALEIDKKPLEYSLRNESFLKLWDPKVKKIFESLYRKDYFENQFFKCSILWGDAREKINIIPSSTKFDLIYLDGFSPQKCPQLWTIEFLSKVTENLKSQGYLITYSSSAAVRKTLRNLGLEIFTIKPSFKNKTFWSQGTVAISKFEKKNDDYNSILVKSIGDRIAEAFAEMLHKDVRTNFWGYAQKEDLTNKELIQEKFEGIRPAPGYPACPDHTEKKTLFELLDVSSNLKVKLTESFAMTPASSVSGLYFGNPQASYFGVGKIFKDQVEDYAKRKKISLSDAEKWLGSNLGYAPN